MTFSAQIAAVAPDERIESIDVVRGIALFGVLIVNLITEFRVSIFQQFLGTTSTQTNLDSMVERIVSLGFEAKAFCLFALLFGVGLAIQYDRLCRLGSPPLYWLFRRLVVLLAIGLVHLLLIWNGDILTDYAVAGLVALPLLLMRARGLLVATASFLALYAAGPVLLYSNLWPDTATLQHHVSLANQVYSSGSFVEVWRFSLQELPLLLPLHIFVFPRTLALFLLGAWLWRAGVLKRPHDFRYQTITAAMVGIVGGAALAAVDSHGFLTRLGARPFLNAFTPVLLALGYGAAIMALMQLSLARRLLSTFAPAGRMAFTNYVLQSVILGFIFFGYGLGQFGRMGAATAFVIGVALYIAQMVLSKWWLRHYRFGPIEWLWRTLMYGVVQPMRKAR